MRARTTTKNYNINITVQSKNEAVKLWWRGVAKWRNHFTRSKQFYHWLQNKLNCVSMWAWVWLWQNEWTKLHWAQTRVVESVTASVFQQHNFHLEPYLLEWTSFLILGHKQSCWNDEIVKNSNSDNVISGKGLLNISSS